MSHFTCLKLLFLWSLSFWENAHLRALTSIAQDIFIEIELRRDLKWEITQWHSPSVGICKIATCRFPNAKMKVFFTHIRIFRRYEWTCEGRGKKRHFGMRCDFLKQIVKMLNAFCQMSMTSKLISHHFHLSVSIFNRKRQRWRWRSNRMLWMLETCITRLTVICNVSFWNYLLFSNQLRARTIFTLTVPSSDFYWPFFFRTNLNLRVESSSQEVSLSLYIFPLENDLLRY